MLHHLQLSTSAQVYDKLEVKYISSWMLQVRLNKWLNELEQMFYGMSFAFDKSLSGDEDMTSALLRNVYNDDKSKQKSADILARYATRSESGHVHHHLQ